LMLSIANRFAPITTAATRLIFTNFILSPLNKSTYFEYKFITLKKE
jgi:hypothetical protein